MFITQRSIMEISIGERPYLPPMAISQMVSMKSVLTFTASPFLSLFSMFRSNGLMYTPEPFATCTTDPPRVRSEERRVGKECRDGGGPCHEKKRRRDGCYGA